MVFNNCIQIHFYMSIFKLLTIIIPTYNMEKYLHKCLDSLIVSDENMQRLEVLVINDGSKDSSSQIAHEYENKYPQTFRVIDKENGNYGSCINRGLKHANGKYVKVLDADDYFDTISFENYLDYLRNCDTDVVISDFCRVDLTGAVISIKSFALPIKTPCPVTQLPSNDVVEMHAITYKTYKIREMNYTQTEGISYTDNEWSILPLINMNSFSYYPQSVYNYLVGRYGQTIDSNSLVKNREQFLKVLYVVLSGIENKQIENGLHKYINNRLCHAMSLIYHTLLVDDKCQHRDELVAFDEHLFSTNLEVYNNIGQEKVHRFIPFRYICYWRNHVRKNILLFPVFVYNCLVSMKSLKRVI